jgi:membrane-associated phospholipid phosphatase
MIPQELRRHAWVGLGILAVALPADASLGANLLTASGDALEIALPLAAAVCATRQHRLGSYATGFLAQTAVTQGLKYGLGDSPINERPNGQSHGFPSGHTAAAASGGTDLAAHCAPDNPAVGILAALGVIVVGASRIEADEHNAVQVLAGAALGATSTGIEVYATPGGGVGVKYVFPF